MPKPPPNLATYAAGFEDMVGGALPEEHLWLFLPCFPVALTGPKDDWRRFWRTENKAHPNTWGQGLIDALACGELDDQPLVMALLPDDQGGAQPNVWDGNHRLAAAAAADIQELPVVLGVPHDMVLAALPEAWQSLPGMRSLLATPDQRLALDMVAKIRPLQSLSEDGVLLATAYTVLQEVGVSCSLRRAKRTCGVFSRAVDALCVDGLLVGLSGHGRWADVLCLTSPSGASRVPAHEIVESPEATTDPQHPHPMARLRDGNWAPEQVSLRQRALSLLRPMAEQRMLDRNTAVAAGNARGPRL